MPLPIDTGVLRTRVVVPPQPVTDYETGQQRTSADGAPLVVVGLTVMRGADAEQIRVRVPGPVQVEQDDLVTVTNLVMRQWSMGERSGVSYSADAIKRRDESPASSAAPPTPPKDSDITPPTPKGAK